MASATELNSRSESSRLYRFLKALRGSLLLSTAALGVVLLGVAVVFDSPLSITQQDGVIAGMLGVFGLSAVLAGGSFYVLLRILYRR